MYFTAIRGTSVGKKLQLTEVLCRGRAGAVPMSLAGRNVKKKKETRSLRKQTKTHRRETGWEREINPNNSWTLIGGTPAVRRLEYGRCWGSLGHVSSIFSMKWWKDLTEKFSGKSGDLKERLRIQQVNGKQRNVGNSVKNSKCLNCLSIHRC